MAKTPRRPAADAPRPVYMGPRIRRLRRELGLTQQAMAEDLSISPSYIALIERNQRPVTADILLRIARGYRLDLAELAVDESADHARRIAGQTGSGHISCDLCHIRHLTPTDYWHHLPLYHIYEPNFAAQCQV